MTSRSIEQPQPGQWMIRLVKNGPRVPAAIVRVETIVEPGEPSNDMRGTRSAFLAAFVAGEPTALDAVWLTRGEPITRAEYEYQLADVRHAQAYRPAEPKAQLRLPIDLATAPPVYARRTK